ncbi:MAG: TonB-dependent receptor [Maribacter sp.]
MIAEKGLAQNRSWIPQDSISIQRAIQLIEKHEGYHFFYNSRLLEKDGTVLLKENASLQVLLAQLVAKTDLGFKVKDNTVILFKTFSENDTLAQQTTADFVRIGFRIFDSMSGELLPDALIRIKGKSIGSLTGSDGTTELELSKQAATNPYEISYLGYQTVDTLISLSHLAIGYHNIAMKSKSIELSEVVVNSTMRKRLQELNAQKNALNSIHVLAAQAKERLPDQNIGEALQRMSGTTITRSYGEGNTVAIRGTPISYSSVQYSGENLPSAQIEGRREVIISGIGLEQAENLTITKTITPDQDGDAIGGTVNLSPNFSNDEQLSIVGEIGSGYNRLSRGIGLNGRFQLSKRFYPSEKFERGRLGIKLGGNFDQAENGRDRIEVDWQNGLFAENPEQYLIRNYNLRDLQNRRTRLGYNVSTDYLYGRGHKAFVHFMYNNRTDREARNRVRYRMFTGNYSDATTVLGADVERDLRDRVKTRKNFALQIGNEMYLGNLKFNTSFFYSKTNRTDDALRTTFQYDDADLVLTRTSTNFPLVQGTDQDLDNVSLYNLESFRPSDLREVLSNTMLGRIDFEKPLETFLGPLSLEWGAKYKQLNNSNERSLTFYDVTGNNPLNFSSAAIARKGHPYFAGRLPFAYRIDRTAVEQYFTFNPSRFTENPTLSLTEQASFYSRTKENIMAAYLTFKVSRHDWDFLTGVRFETNRGTYRANEVLLAQVEGGNSVIPQEKKTNYSLVLPNFQVKHRFNDKSQARFALTTGYARPNYNEISPRRIIDVEDEEVILGNSDLKPAASTNIDLSYELYTDDIGSFSIGTFYKRITDFVYRTNTLTTGNEWQGAIASEGYQLTSYENGIKADLYGLEFNAQTRLKFLPGFLKYFSVIGNYSLTNSKANTVGDVSVRLPGQAENFGNLMLAYDKKGFSAAAALNYTDDYLFAIGVVRAEDLLVDSRYQLDVNVAQKLGKNLRIYAEFINLTNRPVRGFFGNKNRIRELETYSWWCRFGIGWKF